MLSARQEHLCTESRWDFSDLSAVFLNCTLKRSPELSHTEGLIRISRAIMENERRAGRAAAPVDYEIASGVYPDMREHGWERDDWPDILEKVLAADILVIGTSIWLGEKTSVATSVVERLYSASHHLNAAGQYAYYGRVGGCLITGNEDGAKHCAMNILYSLQHLGYVIPPQADAAWLGEGGSGAVLPGRGVRRAGERLHEPQHDLHDLEPAAHGADDQGRRGNSGPRQPALGVGRRLPLRPPQPALPVMLDGRRQRRWRRPASPLRERLVRPAAALARAMSVDGRGQERRAGRDGQDARAPDRRRTP